MQEYLDVMKELRSDGLEKAYLEDVDKKLEHVVSCAFQNELPPGIAVTLAQFFLRFGYCGGIACRWSDGCGWKPFGYHVYFISCYGRACI